MHFRSGSDKRLPAVVILRYRGVWILIHGAPGTAPTRKRASASVGALGLSAYRCR